MKYNHREAFKHMQYHGDSGRAKIFLTIWNSRDGVTPFCTYSNDFGVELAHVNWGQDKPDPDYKPKKGDLIWRDYTEKEAKDFGRKWFATQKSTYEELKDLTHEEVIAKGYQWNPISVLKNIVDQGEEVHVERFYKDLFVLKQPKLELVQEDWI